MIPIVLNEILYDPPGADAGLEFVEIAAAVSADPEASLSGWVLETGNGAGAGTWTVAWIGGPGDRLRDGLFVVGEADVEPAPDAVRVLDLQNGPDACRLRAPGGGEDVLGWGDPLPAGFFEGAPAADAASAALARLPDGRDTGNNAADFAARPPTPGRHNAPPDSLLVEKFVSPGADAPPGAEGVFLWEARNLGRSTRSFPLRAACAVHPGETLARATLATLAPGERGSATAHALPPPGDHVPVADPGGLRGGAAWAGGTRDLAVTEVMSRPRAGEREWIELVSLSARSLALDAFAIRDASGSRAALEGVLSPGAIALVSPDTVSLARHWNLPGAVLLVEAAPWPPLNHTASGDEVAERLELLLAERAVDAAALPGGAREGVSWERVSAGVPGDGSGAWMASADPSGGTPGRENSARGDRSLGGGAQLAVDPAPFRPGTDGTVLLAYRRVRPGVRCTMAVYDASGVLVAELDPWVFGPGEHRALWDGRTGSGEPAALGLYVIVARTPGERAARGTLAVLR